MTAPPPGAVPRFVALHVRDYRRYFLLALMSMMAENVEHVISYWVMFQTFHSPTLAGFAVISHWVPFLLFSFHAGALADRSDCRKLIQVSQALYMLVSIVWGLLFLTGALAVWHAAALLLIHGAAGVIVSPAIQLIIHDMVGPAQLPSAIRLNASSRYLAILLGPAVGGGLMVWLGSGWGLIANLVFYVPFTIFLARSRYTGHAEGAAGRPHASLRVGDAWRLLAQVSADRRLLTMLVLGGATSFFVGSAFQAQMPGYAHDLGPDETGLWYSVLLAANAAGAILGVVLLESANVFRLHARTAIVCAGAWGVTIGLFALAGSYPLAVALLILAGVFNIVFTSIAQTLVQLLAPPHVRGRVVGLFNTASLGLRAGSGVTVGVLGAAIDIHWSLALSAAAVVATSVVLLARAPRAP